MAKRKSRKKQNTQVGTLIRLKTFFKDPKVRIGAALLFLFFAIYLVLAFISFYFTYTTDYSRLNMSWMELVGNADIKVDNMMGKTGAVLASIFIQDWFGLASMGFPLLLIISSLKLFRIKNINFKRFLRDTIILGIWLSIILGFILGDTYDANWSGAYGFYMNKWLNAFVGKIGTVFILLISLSLYILFTFPNIQMKFNRWIDKLSGMSGLNINLLKIKIPEKWIKKAKNIDSKFKKESKPQTVNNKEEEKIKNKEKEDTKKLVHSHEFVLGSNGEVRDKTENNLDFEVSVAATNDEKGININSTKTEISTTENDLPLNVLKNEDILVEKQNEELEDYDPTLDLSNYQLPPINLLEDHKIEVPEVTNDELMENKSRIVTTLRNFKIDITKIKAMIGPTITLYEIVPAPGVRISKIKNLEDDIALNLAALGIRIIAPMPGRGTVGIEVPNKYPKIVSMRSVITSSKFQESKFELPIAFGKTISNETYVVDLTKMPHLLVAGATGQGKSVGLNAIIASLIYKKHPSQLKFVFVDPKKVELSLYEKLEKHFLAKLPDADEAIITDNQQVINTLASLTKEMDDRYNLLKKGHVKNIKEYNTKFIARKLNPQKGHSYMPYIVLVIDEFADLIMTAGKEVEQPLGRLAQLARAVGIHLIVATQRPSTNIITGVIKANFPTRIAFKVASMIDSRTILDSPGANQLVGRGDMLVTQGSDLIRLQCAFIDTGEIESIVDYVSKQQGYTQAFMLPEYETDENSGVSKFNISEKDDLFEDAARVVVLHQQGSTSLIQRKLSIGYNRAGRIIDQLEAVGIVGPFEGSKARQVLIPDDYSLEQFLNSLK